MSAGFSRWRLWGLLRKESLQVVRDPSSIAIAFLLPLVLLFLFGYGVSLDAKDVPVGMVVEQPSTQAQLFADSFASSEYFELVRFNHIRPAQDALRRGDIKAIVWLRSDFERRLLSSQAPIGLFVNGTDANTARIVEGYVQGAWQGWLAAYARDAGHKLPTPVVVAERIWFNAAVRSTNFLVPGLMAVIMTLIGTLLTAMVVAREWERGTMEALMVTPVTVGEILLGKLVPYFFLGLGGMIVSVLLAVFLFEVPLRGSLWVLFGSAGLFMLAALGMGLLISTVARNQFVAGQVALVTSFLPAFILSGFIFNIGSMPAPIQVITYLIPARYFVTILQSVFLAGDVWEVIWPNALALALMAAFLLTVVVRKTKKSLE